MSGLNYKKFADKVKINENKIGAKNFLIHTFYSAQLLLDGMFPVLNYEHFTEKVKFNKNKIGAKNFFSHPWYSAKLLCEMIQGYSLDAPKQTPGENVVYGPGEFEKMVKKMHDEYKIKAPDSVFEVSFIWNVLGAHNLSYSTMSKNTLEVDASVQGILKTVFDLSFEGNLLFFEKPGSVAVKFGKHYSDNSVGILFERHGHIDNERLLKDPRLLSAKKEIEKLGRKITVWPDGVKYKSNEFANIRVDVPFKVINPPSS